MHRFSDDQRAFERTTAPRFTIITATYNVEEVLQRCIDSVAAQRYLHKEHIIVDGASRDDTVAVIARNEHRIAFWSSEPDTGVYQAWNKGLRQSSGEWIGFLGADEWYAGDDVLESVALEIAKPDRQEPVVYGCTRFVNQIGKVVAAHGEPWCKARLQLPHNTPLPTAAMFFHRSLFRHYGQFDEGFRIAGDYEFMLRFLSNHDARFIPDLTVTYSRIGGLSLSRENEVTRLREVARSKRRHGYPAYSVAYARNVLEAFVSTMLPRLVGKGKAATIRAFYRKLFDRKPPVFEE
jgi:glycosyltransferase involved in cell wall biosynthesis